MVHRLFHFIHVGYDFTEKSFGIDFITLDEYEEGSGVVELTGIFAFEISKRRIYLHVLGLDLIDEEN